MIPKVVPPGSAGVPPACSSLGCFRQHLRAGARGQVLSPPTRLDSYANPFPWAYAHGYLLPRLRRSTRIQAVGMHRIVSAKSRLAIPGIRKPAPDHRPSRLPVQEPLVLSILLILCIHVHKKCRFPGAVAVRSNWRRGPGCAGYGAGGTPALPGGLHSMTGPHQGDKIAGAFRGRLSLKDVRPYLCLFVFIRGSSLLAATCFWSQ